jgi:hypothetical protein
MHSLLQGGTGLLMMSVLLQFLSQHSYHKVISIQYFQELNPYDYFLWRVLKNSVCRNVLYIRGATVQLMSCMLLIHVAGVACANCL